MKAIWQENKNLNDDIINNQKNQIEVKKMFISKNKKHKSFVSANKKGMTWEQLVLAIIAVVVVVLIILWFKSGGEKGFGFAEEKTKELSAGDTDGDEVPDILDTCKGTKDEQKGWDVDAKGCKVEPKKSGP